MPIARRRANPSNGKAEAGVQRGRTAPPIAPGMPPSRRIKTTEEKLQSKHPGRRGRIPADVKDLIMSEALANLQATPQEIAIKAGVSTRGRPVRDIIKTARETLASRAEELVECVVVAAKIAAVAGDHKPAAWALERIQEEGLRVVDPPQEPGAAAPKQGTTFHLGIAIGGVPQPKAEITVDDRQQRALAVTAEELPPLEAPDAAAVPEELLP